jgi:membrane associated rhomboid family serine protease
MLNQMGAGLEADARGVAYAAHIGGALFGIVTACLFQRHVDGAALAS